jgi:hypothetical protein
MFSLSQHDALVAIQSRLDDIDERQQGQSTASAAEFREIRDAVAELPSIAARINRVASAVDKLSTGQLSKDPRGRIFRLWMVEIADRDLSRLLGHLPPLPYRERHRDLQLRRMEGAGQWILDTPEFVLWREGTRHQDNTIWCNGQPGAGKTYLA